MRSTPGVEVPVNFFLLTEVNHKVRPKAVETWIKRPCGLEQGPRIHVN